MAIDDGIFFATIGELSAKLRAREFSAVELTRCPRCWMKRRFCENINSLRLTSCLRAA